MVPFHEVMRLFKEGKIISASCRLPGVTGKTEYYQTGKGKIIKWLTQENQPPTPITDQSITVEDLTSLWTPIYAPEHQIYKVVTICSKRDSHIDADAQFYSMNDVSLTTALESIKRDRNRPVSIIGLTDTGKPVILYPKEEAE